MKCWVNILGWAELISLLTAAKITTTFFRSAAAHGGGRVPPVARLLSNFTLPGSSRWLPGPVLLWSYLPLHPEEAWALASVESLLKTFSISSSLNQVQICLHVAVWPHVSLNLPFFHARLGEAVKMKSSLHTFWKPVCFLMVSAYVAFFFCEFCCWTVLGLVQKLDGETWFAVED